MYHDSPSLQVEMCSMLGDDGTAKEHIVILSDIYIHFFSFDGQDTARYLPYHGATIWPINPGLLIHVGGGDRNVVTASCSQLT